MGISGTGPLSSQAAKLALVRGQMPVDFGQASEKIGVILVKLIDYSGKLPNIRSLHPYIHLSVVPIS